MNMRSCHRKGKDKTMTVNICGIPHKVVECEDKFDVDAHFGQINYKECEIRINKDMPASLKSETICHEMVHGIFMHLGYDEHANNEQLVQALAVAIHQGFTIMNYDNEHYIDLIRQMQGDDGK